MRSLSLDQALQTTGWAIFDDGQLKQAGHFTIPATGTIENRLGKMWQELEKLYEEYNFDQVFYEDIQRQQNVETFKKLAYVQAAVILWCYNRDIKSAALGPSHWRSVIKDSYGVNFGKVRAEQKAAAQSFIKEKFSITASEDECDAICLGLAAIQEKKQKTSAF